MSLVSGLDVEGSRTVASSTPVRFSVSLTDARAAFERLSARTRAVLQRVRFTFADATAMDYAVNVDGLDPLSAPDGSWTSVPTTSARGSAERS